MPNPCPNPDPKKVKPPPRSAPPPVAGGAPVNGSSVVPAGTVPSPAAHATGPRMASTIENTAMSRLVRRILVDLPVRFGTFLPWHIDVGHPLTHRRRSATD